MNLEKKVLDDLKRFENDPEFIVHSLLMKINEDICRRLFEMGISYSRFAKLLNVSKAYISKILNGKPNLTLQSLVNIATALDMDLKIDFKERKSDFQQICKEKIIKWPKEKDWEQSLHGFEQIKDTQILGDKDVRVRVG